MLCLWGVWPFPTPLPEKTRTRAHRSNNNAPAAKMDPTVTPEESVDAAVSDPVLDGQSTPSNSSTDTLVEMESVNISR